jgi:threonine/homoserine/homoserine lactone efflux protein
MLGIQDLALFVISGLLLNIAPGPDSLLIMTRSATQGWRAGSAAALGIGTGTLVHVAAAALGLSAVLATSATAFTLVKYAGAAYLLYLGIGLLLSKPHQQETRGVPLAINPVALPHRKIFMQGFFTNVLNPKVALFFLAFVPQFISPESPNKALTFITLGLIFNFNGMLWCHFLAASTAFASQRIRVNNLVSMWINRLIGAVFVSLGIRLALAESS